MKSVMNKSTVLLLVQSIGFLITNKIYSQGFEEKIWNLSTKDTILIDFYSRSKFNICSGDSQGIRIELTNNNNPKFQYSVTEEEGKVILHEDIMDYNSKTPTPKSNFYWNLVLPNDVTIIMEGASVDLYIHNFKGSIINKSAICNAKVRDSNCGIEMSIAKCDIELENCVINFNVSSSQGDFYANGVSITGKSSFTTGYGDVEVKLSKQLKSDLVLGSNFGSVILDFNGSPIEENFEFIARADKGKIVCPYKFDAEQMFKSQKMIYNDYADFKELVHFHKKYLIRGDQKPKILLKTVTGKVKVTD